MLYEVEKRAFLNQGSSQELITKFKKSGYRNLASFTRVAFVYVSNADFVPDPDGKVDLRVRIDVYSGTEVEDRSTNVRTSSKPVPTIHTASLVLPTVKSKLTLKYGNWKDSSGRKEYEFNFDVTSLSDVLNMLKIMGYQYGFVTKLRRQNFAHGKRGFVFDSYITSDDIVFEIEEMVEKKSDVIKVEQVLEKYLEARGLSQITSEEMQEFVRRLIETGLKYNFAKDDINAWLLEFVPEII